MLEEGNGKEATTFENFEVLCDRSLLQAQYFGQGAVYFGAAILKKGKWKQFLTCRLRKVNVNVLRKSAYR